MTESNVDSGVLVQMKPGTWWRDVSTNVTHRGRTEGRHGQAGDGPFRVSRRVYEQDQTRPEDSRLFEKVNDDE